MSLVTHIMHESDSKEMDVHTIQPDILTSVLKSVKVSFDEVPGQHLSVWILRQAVHCFYHDECGPFFQHFTGP
jgi:hypothetical protein